MILNKWLPKWTVIIAFIFLAFAILKTNGRAWQGVGISRSTDVGQIHTHPDVAIDTGNNLHVVWTFLDLKNYIFQVHYARYDGSSWSIPVNISDGTANGFISPKIAVRDNIICVVWPGKQSSSNEGIYYASYDGTNWTTPAVIPYTTGRSDDPILAADKDNRLHILWHETISSSNTEIYWSNYDGTNWSTPVNISNTPGSSYASVLAVGKDNSLHVLWRDVISSTNHDIYYTSFNGAGWMTPMNISNTPGASHRQVLAVDKNNWPHVLWEETISSTNHDIYYTSFNGAGWMTPMNISNTSRASIYPDIVIDNNNQIYVVWTEEGDYTWYYEINYSIYNGNSWSSPQNIPNPYPQSSAGGPTILVDGYNQLHMIWVDRTSAIPPSPPQYQTLRYIKYKRGYWSPYIMVGQAWYAGLAEGMEFIVDNSNTLHLVWATHSSLNSGHILYSTDPNTNTYPLRPRNPSPADGAIDQFVNTSLSWQGIDPDEKDTLTYDIYFGTSSSPSLVETGHSSTSYNPGTLHYATTYYWKIVTQDNHGAETSGPVWSFITVKSSLPPNNRPVAQAGPDQVVATGVPVTLDGSSSSDPDGDRILYSWTLLSKPEGSQINIADGTAEAFNLTPDQDGFYKFQLIVSDGQTQSSPNYVTIKALGDAYKLMVATNKKLYLSGDTLELYIGAGNAPSGPEIKADAYIGFGFQNESLYFFDPTLNLKHADPEDPRSFIPFVQGTILTPGIVFPTPAEMNADSDANGKLDSFGFFSVTLPQNIPPGKYFAFGALVEPGTVQIGNPKLIGQVSVAPFTINP